MIDIWKVETFEAAHSGGPRQRDGFVYRGLGLHKQSEAGRRQPARWTVTQLGTGHAIAYLSGDAGTVFPVATEIADAGDWDFLSMKGWKDKFPDAPEQLALICARYPAIARMEPENGFNHGSHEIAQQIAANRP